MASKKLVYGIGINDLKGIKGEEVCKIVDGVRWDSKEYKLWESMLARVLKSSDSKNPSYQKITVCGDWYYYSRFKSWATENMPDDMTNMSLDKDLRGMGRGIYSPETCMFIPKDLNSAINFVRTKGSGLPIGVTKTNKEGVYRFSSKDIKGNRHYTRCKGIEQTHFSYLSKKIEYILLFIEKYPYLSKEIQDYCLYLQGFIDRNEIFL